MKLSKLSFVLNWKWGIWSLERRWPQLWVRSASAIEFDLFLFRYLTIDFLSILAVQAVDLEIFFIRRKLLEREIDSNDWSTRNKPIRSRMIFLQFIFPNASIYNFLVACNTSSSLLLVRTLTLPKVCSKFLSQTSTKLLL